MMTNELFNREGESASERKLVKNDSGKLGYWTFSPCTRCGGAGGFKEWPGFTCFRCGGNNSMMFEQHFHRVYTAEQLAKMNAAQAKRDAKKSAKQEAERIAFEAKVAANTDKFNTENAALLTRLARFFVATEEETREQRLVTDIVRKGREHGSVTDAQRAALESVAAAAEKRDAVIAASQHVGTIGERVEVEVEVTHVASFERNAYQRYGTETVYIVSMTDASGNVFVSKTPNFREEKGERFILRATVKEHSEYRGVKQTVVQRAKRVEIKK